MHQHVTSQKHDIGHKLQAIGEYRENDIYMKFLNILSNNAYCLGMRTYIHGKHIKIFIEMMKQ